MMKWIGRLATAVLTLLVLARAASAQDYPPPQATYAPAYGYTSPPGPPPAYDGGYGQSQGRPRIYVEDMYGQWHEANGEEYDRVYAYAQQQQPQPGAAYQYVNVPGPCCEQPPAPPPSYQPPPYQPPYTPPPPSCGGGCYTPPPPPSCGGCCTPSYPPPGYPPAPPSCPPSWPPGYGEVRLNDSFFYGSGGVGPEVIYSGGGGGYAYAGASSSSWASASASARVSFGGGGGHRPPPHRPPPPRGGGGCGCH